MRRTDAHEDREEAAAIYPGDTRSPDLIIARASCGTRSARLGMVLTGPVHPSVRR
jgi:hypothetical protein